MAGARSGLEAARLFSAAVLGRPAAGMRLCIGTARAHHAFCEEGGSTAPSWIRAASALEVARILSRRRCRRRDCRRCRRYDLGVRPQGGRRGATAPSGPRAEQSGMRARGRVRTARHAVVPSGSGAVGSLGVAEAACIVGAAAGAWPARCDSGSFRISICVCCDKTFHLSFIANA